MSFDMRLQYGVTLVENHVSLKFSFTFVLPLVTTHASIFDSYEI